MPPGRPELASRVETPGGATWAVVVAFAVGALIYLPFLGASDLTYPDEPDVAAPALEMWVSGDLVTPRQNGAAWIDYPPLVHWCGVASSRLLGGMSEFALRLPVALAAMLLAALTGAFAARRFGTGVGVLAALLLLTFPHYAYQATNYHPDMLFALGQGAGLLLYAAAERRTPGAAWGMRVLAFGCFGAAFLAKGPLGLLLPGLVLSVWHLSLGQVRRTLLLAPLALAALAVAFPWYALLVQANGLDWVWSEFVAQNFQRFETGKVRGHDRPWVYYVVRIWHCLGLWSAALPLALGWGFRTRLWADPLRRLVLLWALVPFLFFTLAATKREVYLLPAYPAFALLIADALSHARSMRAPLLALHPDSAARLIVLLSTLGAIGMVVSGAVGAVALPHLAWHLEQLPEAARPVVAAFTPFALALALLGVPLALLLWRARARDRVAWGLGGAAALHALPWLLLMSLALPCSMPLRSYKPHGRWLDEHLAPGERLGMLAPGRESIRRAAFLYYAGRRLEFLRDADGLDAYLRGAPGRLAVVEAGLAQGLLDGDPRFHATERRRFQVENSAWVVMGRP